jgi:hypothetical protein
MNSQDDEYSRQGAVSVQPLPPYQLQVTLRDDREIILNLQTLIEQRDAYWRLRQTRYFCRVSVDPLGGICWPEGEDLAPGGLERYSEITR